MAEEGPRPKNIPEKFYRTDQLTNLFEGTGFEREALNKLFLDGIISAKAENPHIGSGNLLHWVTESLNNRMIEKNIRPLIEVLLQNGVDINGLNKYGRTPIVEAILSDKLLAVMILVLNGADLQPNGENILFLARSKPMAEFLVNSGAPYKKNQTGRTPLNRKMQNMQKFAEYFKEKNINIQTNRKRGWTRQEKSNLFNRNVWENEVVKASELISYLQELESKQTTSGGKQTRRNNRKNRKSRKNRK